MRGLAGLFQALPGLAAASLAGTAIAAPAADAPVPERLTACVACHGAGTSASEGVPSLGGQQGDYVVTQLFQFREKQREAAPMNDIAAGFSDDDLRAYGEAIATLPAPEWSGPPADAALKERAQAAIAKHQCTSCHGADLAGRDAIPRIRAQREEYLARALSAYKSNARPGYDPAMNEVAQDLKDDEIRDLAAYIARL
ncbi:c-type cytochrome [Methylobacterium persicinum]|uniref:Cytochrome c553 n=1 Tax=Methylobacterium persicinum TaxID=374426 RepID=A0ABU0HNK2_9HYPH|nr:c-type cytochrome [Methylobacterium persicinum]MDQ0443413.1 cytochrome c553 [Methylobacterium persicinum]GJE38663.1 Cytochrome c-552 [Methylobacterium persicinum]